MPTVCESESASFLAQQEVWPHGFGDGFTGSCDQAVDDVKLRPLVPRFFEKVRKTDSCWLWRGAKNADGYGLISLNDISSGLRRVRRAHQVSWMIHYGDYDNALNVLHKCDVPSCVRPEHLWLGTRADNMQDMWTKDRHPKVQLKGERNPFSKLTDDQVILIRNQYSLGNVSLADLAAEFGVTFQTISRIVNRRIWKHL